MYLVVGFHAGSARVEGGFIGVDVFFVLSGYLVTNILLQDLMGTEQRVALGRFYARRARRLLPAAAVSLVVTALVFARIGTLAEIDAARAAIRSAALYFANWHFITQSADYFAADVDSSPVLHYWSLSVEEQFYLLWPLVLGGLWSVTRLVGRHQRRIIQGVVAAAAVSSALMAIRLAAGSLPRAYYGTDTRAYQLLAGALLALAPGLVARLSKVRLRPALPLLSLGLIVGLVVTAVDLQRLDPIERGILTTVLTVGIIATLEASQGGPARWALSRASVGYLGKISYGTYLWHWLIIVVLSRETDLAPGTTAVLTAVIATALASLSYQLIEQPIRTASMPDRWWQASVAAGLALSLVVGLVVAPVAFSRAEEREANVPVARGTATEASGVPTADSLRVAWMDVYDYGACEVSGPVACRLHAGDGPRALIIGESHAAMFTPMLVDIAEEHDLDLRAAFLSFCPWPRGIAYRRAGRNCFEDQRRAYDEILRDFDPDIVFLAHRPIDDPVNPVPILTIGGSAFDGGSAQGAEALVSAVTDSVVQLEVGGRTVVIFEPIPVPPDGFDSLRCLSSARSLDECRYVATDELGPETLAMRALAEDRLGVFTVPTDHLVCRYHPICDPVAGDVIVWRDDNHLTITFATSLADEVGEYLEGVGVLDQG